MQCAEPSVSEVRKEDPRATGFRKIDDHNPTFSDKSIFLDHPQTAAQVTGYTSLLDFSIGRSFTSELSDFDISRPSLCSREVWDLIKRHKKTIPIGIATVPLVACIYYFISFIIRDIRLRGLWGEKKDQREAVEELCKYHVPLSIAENDRNSSLMCAYYLVENVAGELAHAHELEHCDQSLFDSLHFLESEALRVKLDMICSESGIKCDKVRSDVDFECDDDCRNSMGMRLNFAAKKLSNAFSKNNIFVNWHSRGDYVMYDKGVALAYALLEGSHHAPAIAAAVIAAELIGSSEVDWVQKELDYEKKIVATIKIDNSTLLNTHFGGTPRELYWALRIERYCNEWFASEREINSKTYLHLLRVAVRTLRRTE